jgi:phosphomannomutase
VAATSGLIVSVSGIRGIVGETLTADVARAFAAALGTYSRGGRIVLSRDGRPSGSLLRSAVLAGLHETGCEIHDLGVVPTPTCGLAVRRLRARAGVQITASHNPAQWNGLKLFAPEGMVLNEAEGAKINELFHSRAFRVVPVSNRQIQECRQAEDWHHERILELLDVASIQACGFKVFLDANGGAGGPLGRRLLETLECRLFCQACDADGLFRHEPEPIRENLAEICPLVPRHEADIGFVLDPDADRLALIDETGRYIGEELTLALAALFRLRQEHGPIVLNMSTSRVSEDIAKTFGCDCHRSAVGEANVVEKMRTVGAVIGGEGNGGVIDPRVGWVRDPFIGMGLILNLLAQTRKKLSELVAELPSYFIVKSKYTLPLNQLTAHRSRLELGSRYAALMARWPEATVNQVDGLRLDWENQWVHLRPSNTEPIVRIIAEARSQRDAENLCREVAGLL